MNSIKISVIIPCYNVEKYIRRGLDSVLAQTFQEWEAILVDDESTDGTGAICEEYASKDARFYVIHRKNGGESCARNTGYDAAKGELVYSMDPDDWAEPELLAQCYDLYSQYHCDIVQFEKYWVSGEKRNPDKNTRPGVWSHEQIIREYTGPLIGLGQDALDGWYRGEDLWSFKKNYGVWAFMFKRTFLERYKLRFVPGINMFADVFFLVECTYRAEMMVTTSDVLYNYDVRQDGAVGNRSSDPLELYTDKCNSLAQRARLRSIVREFDLHDYYLGSQVLSLLQLCSVLSCQWKNLYMVNSYADSPYVRESVGKVSIKGAPLKFKLPVMFIKHHGHVLLFAFCWMMRKCGLNNMLKI